MSGPTTLYSCFDFRFASEIPLGELTPAAVDDQRELVVIRYGTPDEASGGDTPDWVVRSDGAAAVLRIPNVAHYTMIGGREIVVAPVAGASDRDVRLFLLGSALGVLAYQRGLLPLHANAVVIDGRAHAFCGVSGAGKSTLAAYFADRGYPVLCDDVCAISLDADGRPLAWPGLPRLKLWQEAADRFGHDTTRLDRAIEGYDKFHVPLPTVAGTASVPFASLYRLDRAEGDAPAEIVRLRGGDAMALVMHNSYRPEYVAPLGLRPAHFAAASAVARHAGIFVARRTWGYDVFGQQADRLVEHARALP